MPTVPTSEPCTITAGETLAWTKTLPDYPASTYTLKYALQLAGQASLITITASASGSNFAINVPLATTGAYAPGLYTWTSYVESAGGTVRNLVARGSVTILASPLVALGGTHATRTLSLIEAAIEGRIPNGLETTNIDGQELQRIPVADLVKLRTLYRGIVASEANAAAIAAGLGNRRHVFGRFTSVR